MENDIMHNPAKHNLDVLHLGACSQCGRTNFIQTLQPTKEESSLQKENEELKDFSGAEGNAPICDICYGSGTYTRGTFTEKKCYKCYPEQIEKLSPLEAARVDCVDYQIRIAELEEALRSAKTELIELRDWWERESESYDHPAQTQEQQMCIKNAEDVTAKIEHINQLLNTK